MMTTLPPIKYKANIGNDPIASNIFRGCESAESAALAARTYAEFGEIITVVGPRGDVTYWEAHRRPGRRLRRVDGNRREGRRGTRRRRLQPRGDLVSRLAASRPMLSRLLSPSVPGRRVGTEARNSAVGEKIVDRL